jgi:hypothetical protein
MAGKGDSAREIGGRKKVRVGFKSLCFLGLLQCMIERKIKRLVKRKKWWC